MACKLIFRRKGERAEHVLQGPSLTVGRDAANQIVLDHDLSVSRFHARFDFDGQHWRVVDTLSRNRVRVNGELIEPDEAGARAVNDGDSIVLGTSEFRFVREDSERLVLENEKETTGQASQTISAVTPMRDLGGLLDSGPRPQLPREAEEIVERAKLALSVVTTVAQRIAALTPADDIIETIVDLVFQTTPAQRAALFLWDEGLGRLVPKRLRSRDDAGSPTITVSESLVRRALVEKCTVQMDPKVLSESMYKLQLRSAVAVPLLDETKAIGVIYADTSLAGGAFDAFGLSLLSALANHAAIALEQARLVRRVSQERRARERLEQYLAPRVVDRILASAQSSADLGMRADEAEVTVLFCDMAGFTARTEHLPPRDVLILLNRYFSHMTEVIHQHEGTLDKYIGDCIMAVFGAPQEQKDHARRGALAALGMRDAILRMNEGQPPESQVEFRIGMHSGKVIAGDVGHVARRDWTVLGSTVNLASRMESAVAKQGQIVLTAATRDGLGDEFELKPVPVSKLPKGISREIQAFELLGRRDAKAPS